MTNYKRAAAQVGLAASFGLAAAVVFNFIPGFSKQSPTLAMACQSAFGPKSCPANMEPPVFKPSSLQ